MVVETSYEAPQAGGAVDAAVKHVKVTYMLDVHFPSAVRPDASERRSRASCAVEGGQTCGCLSRLVVNSLIAQRGR